MTAKDSVSEHVESLVKNIKASDKDKLFLVACTVELMRRAQQIDPRASQAIVNFLSRVTDVKWGSISFSMTQAVLARGREVAKQYLAVPEENEIQSVLLDAMAVFADILAAQPEEATEPVFDAVVAEISEQRNRPPAAPAIVPEIFQYRMADKIFKAKPVDDKICAQLNTAYVMYKSPTGPDLRGLALDSGADLLHVILETGEYVAVPATENSLRAMARPEDYAGIPSVLLAYAFCLSDLFPQSIKHGDPKLLGEFTADNLHMVLVDRSQVATLHSVIDKAKSSASMGPTGPVGASARFSVPDTGLTVVLDASVAATGPYVVSKVVRANPDGTDQILMRHETPRDNSLYGIYLFPLKDATVLLKVM